MPTAAPDFDAAVADLWRGKNVWARAIMAACIAVLQQIKDALLTVSQAWAETAARRK